MSTQLMVLPARNFGKIRVVSVPEDYEAHEAYRHLTGIISALEERGDSNWDDLAEALEAEGFVPLGFILGPEIG